MATPAQLLAVERGQIGYSRWTDPQPGTIYGRWYAKKTGNPWFGTNGVAFCAMGQSWSFDQVKQAAPGLPTAGCGTIRDAARRARRVVNRRDARQGDIVLFRWDGNIDDMSYSDHVGVVDINLGAKGIQTVEFNTNNGSVAPRTRSWSVVQMVVRPEWTGASGTPAATASKLDLGDLNWTGQLMVKEWQKQLGCKYVDGIISGQTQYNCKTILWAVTVTERGSKGSPMVTALQKFLNARGFDPSGIDGHFGKNSVKALQRFLNAKLGTKLDVDGIYGNATSRAVGAALEKGLFRG